MIECNQNNVAKSLPHLEKSSIVVSKYHDAEPKQTLFSTPDGQNVLYEEDTKLHLITPALQQVGWTGPRISMEYPITAGQILLHGDGHKKLNPLKADYLLRYGASLPIAVVEAKDEDHLLGAGLQQAMVIPVGEVELPVSVKEKFRIRGMLR